MECNRKIQHVTDRYHYTCSTQDFFQKLPNFQENLEEMLVLVYVRRSLISVCKAS